MKFVDEYRDAELGQVLAGQILATVEPDRHYKVMEVCGGHTHSIYKYGIDDLLPENVELVHGPGCPVCVIPMGRVDDGIAIAHEPGVIFTCFGDMLRVPGARGTLLEAKAAGADVRMVYSPLDALRIAKQNPDREVVFFAIGFETTAPSTALTLKRAKAEGVPNFSCVCNHVTIVPPLRALLESPDLRLDGFIGPGHVCTVVGARPLEFIPADYGRPVVVSGFEPLDILQSIQMILAQLADGRCEVENQYKRVVPHEGNLRALEVMAEVFELRPHFEWRGLGFISQSALKLGPTPTPTSTPSCASACPACASPTRRHASAARCSRASSSRGSARCSARRARPSTRSAPAWSRRRAPARPITTTAASRARGRSCDASPTASSGSSGSSRPRGPSGRSSRTRASRWPTAPAARRRRR